MPALIPGTASAFILACAPFAISSGIVGFFSRAGVGKWVKRVIGTSFNGAGIGLAFAGKF